MSSTNTAGGYGSPVLQGKPGTILGHQQTARHAARRWSEKHAVMQVSHESFTLHCYTGIQSDGRAKKQTLVGC